MKLIEENNGTRFEGDWLDIFEVLQLIKWRPSLYIGNRKIKALWDFLQGYQMALNLNKLQEKSYPDFRLFSTWIKGRIKSEYDLTVGWDYHLFNFFKDDEKALEHFFEFLEEFKSSEPICEIQKIQDFQRDYFHQNQYWIENYNRVKEILIFKLPPSKSYWCIFLSEDMEKVAETYEKDRKEIISSLRRDFKISEYWNKLPMSEGSRLVKRLMK
jgi:hypothetical protein